MATPSGEITLKIKDTEYVLRPSFKFITRVEDLLDRSITSVVIELANGNLRYGHIAVVIQQGIIAAGGKPPSFDEIGEWLRSIPIVEVAEPVTRMLSEALQAGPKA
jgi:hypothetical protein